MKRKIASVAVCAVVLSVAGWAVAQAGEEAAKPGPEHAKLGYFVGSWTGEGDVADSPFGPGGKMTWKESCDWFEGKFAVVCKSEGKGPSGAMKGLGIMGYSTEQGVYTWYGVDNHPMTMTTVPMGTLDGKTWTFTDESEMGDATFESRFIIEEVSPTSYTFRWETLGENGEWTTISKGKLTKGS